MYRISTKIAFIICIRIHRWCLPSTTSKVHLCTDGNPGEIREFRELRHLELRELLHQEHPDIHHHPQNHCHRQRILIKFLQLEVFSITNYIVRYRHIKNVLTGYNEQEHEQGNNLHLHLELVWWFFFQLTLLLLLSKAELDAVRKIRPLFILDSCLINIIVITLITLAARVRESRKK